MRRRTVRAAGIVLVGLALAPFETGPAPLACFALAFVYVAKAADGRRSGEPAGPGDYVLAGAPVALALALGIAVV